MGDAQGQGGVAPPVFFLDENHCGNSYVRAAFQTAGILFESHLDHFQRGVEDTFWIPIVASRNWAVLTADARIRHNSLERQAVKSNGLKLFYFSRNDFAGIEMGDIIRKALPKMVRLCLNHEPPFAASISRSSDVTIRDTFADL